MGAEDSSFAGSTCGRHRLLQVSASPLSTPHSPPSPRRSLRAALGVLRASLGVLHSAHNTARCTQHCTLRTTLRAAQPAGAWLSRRWRSASRSSTALAPLTAASAAAADGAVLPGAVLPSRPYRRLCRNRRWRIASRSRWTSRFRTTAQIGSPRRNKRRLNMSCGFNYVVCTPVPLWRVGLSAAIPAAVRVRGTPSASRHVEGNDG